MKIKYYLNLIDPEAHEIEVKMIFSAIRGEETELTLPSWIPGSYMIRNFARNINKICISSISGKELILKKIDKQTWSYKCIDEEEVVVTYRIYAFDLSVRSAYFDNTRAYFNGACIFLRLVGKENSIHELILNEPHFAKENNWQVATEMQSQNINESGFGKYISNDYYEFIDSPFEISEHSSVNFFIDDKNHRMIFVDAGEIDLNIIASDVSKICEEQFLLFGDLPLNSYLFMTLATSNDYGGLEHRNSSSLICKRSDLPFKKSINKSDGYIKFLSLCSHEYFHLWNVKRIQPKAVKYSNLSVEAYTKLLWVFEGITSYYDNLALPRSGILNSNEYLNLLAQEITRYLRTEGRHTQSLEDSSFYTWTKFYIQNENSWNETISYYNKGALIAFGLDLEIREHTDNKFCLDHFMRYLWNKYGKTGQAIPEMGIQKDLESLTQCSFQKFFEKYIRGTVQLPLQQWAAGFGLGLNLRPSKNEKDCGGYTEGIQPNIKNKNNLGAIFEGTDNYLKISKVKKNGSAQKAGLSSGDILISLDGERCRKGNLEFLLNKKDA